MAHKETTQIKKAKIDNLNRKYELFWMLEKETIKVCNTRFTAIVNENDSLGELIPTGKAIRKLLCVLPDSWERKMEAIMEARDLDVLTMDELIGIILTYEQKKNQEKDLSKKRKEKNLILMTIIKEDFKEENIALMTKISQRMMRKGQGG